MEKIIINCELYSIKNGKRIVFNKTTRKPFLIKSKASMEIEQELEYELLRNKPKWLSMIQNKPKPYKLHIFIYRKTKRVFDGINIIQGMFDLMTKMEYWEDDNMNILLIH